MDKLSPLQYAKQTKEEIITQIRLQEVLTARKFDDLIEVIDQLSNKIKELTKEGNKDDNKKG